MSLSLQPDPWMRWIYDPQHPDYDSERAQDLRRQRERALQATPGWVKELAHLNDSLREQT